MKKENEIKEILSKKDRNKILDNYQTTVENLLIKEKNDDIIKVLTNLLFNIELLKITYSDTNTDLKNIGVIKNLITALTAFSYINKNKKLF